MTLAKEFVNIHLPYRKKYITKYPSKDELFSDTNWRTKNAFLSDIDINEAIKGVITLGYFASTITQVVGVDIDNHKNRAESWLLSIYDQIVAKFNAYPSVLVRSPRGLHAFWYLTQPYSTEIIKEYTKQRLNGLLDYVDIRPDTSNALRIPVEENLLDPETLEPLNQSASFVMQTAERYNAIALFFQEWQQQLPTKQNTPHIKRQRLNMLKNGAKIVDRESEIVPYGFINGKTNQPFLDLALLYRTNGLDIDTAYERFIMLLNRSHLYTGDIKRRLRKRLEFEYKKNQYKPSEKEYQPTLFDQQTINYAVDNSPFATQRNNPIRHFMTELLKWRNVHDQVAKNPVSMQNLNYYFKYYWKARKEGYYPLPQTLLKRWNKRYYELLPYLTELGILEPSPYGYWAGKNREDSIVKYYSIRTIEQVENVGVVNNVAPLLKEYQNIEVKI